MKLPSRDEIQQKKSIERKLEIDEGAKLARRVDELRQTVATEEANLNIFRTETVKTVHAEIQALVKERDGISEEIVVLKGERRLLQIPLDAEWAKVEKRNTELDSLQASLDQQIIGLEKREKELQERITALAVEEQRIADLKDRADDLLLRSNEKHKIAEKFESDAQKKLDEAQAFAESKKKELRSREAKVAVKERQSAMKAESLEKKKIELENWERQINDKYETLLRTQERINHGKRI